MNHLLCFGFGYSASAFVNSLDRSRWRISATSRTAQGLAAIAAAGCTPVPFTEASLKDKTTHVLVSAPPGEKGDPVLARYAEDLARFRSGWVGYLSTTGVYGDHGGAWITEETPLTPNLARSRARVAAEQHWLAMAHDHKVPVHIFRLAGIYGPGRNAIVQLRAGTARRIIKPGQIFSRIHVADIAEALARSMARPDPGRIYNAADDEPCPPQDVIAYAARLVGISPPPEEDYATASLSPMARSFYADCKRVSNARIKTELGLTLRYPTYREGLKACL